MLAFLTGLLSPVLARFHAVVRCVLFAELLDMGREIDDDKRMDDVVPIDVACVLKVSLHTGTVPVGWSFATVLQSLHHSR